MGTKRKRLAKQLAEQTVLFRRNTTASFQEVGASAPTQHIAKQVWASSP